MNYDRFGRETYPRPLVLGVAVLLGALTGCSTAPPTGSTPGVTSGGNGGAGGSGGAPVVPEGCEAAPQLVRQRLVRLNRAQFERTTASLLTPAALQGATLEDPRQREFQALATEGPSVNIDVLRTTLGLSEHAANTVSARFAEATGCADADDVCVKSFLGSFAAKAYRRPVTSDELASVTEMYTQAKTVFATSATAGVKEATLTAIRGILASPGTLYRTELGQPAAGATEAQLTPYEMASLLSYFLLDGPPDDGLLQAAASGALGSNEGIAAEVQRLLGGDVARRNLTQAMIAYYSLKGLDTTLKDPATFPDFTVGLRNSMYAETEKFTQHVLWTGKVNDLLTSRTTFVNEGLAAHYGVTYPGPPGGDFMQVELPANQRAGLLTQASIMTLRARTKNTSVVSRGLFVNGVILCITQPPAPPATVLTELEAQVQDETQSERQKADYRAKTAPCNGCHAIFDAYGLVLENYDGIGKYRTEYKPGVGIDTSATLPAALGGGPLANVIELITKATETGAFSSCVTTNLMKYALTDASVLPYGDCGIKQTHDKFKSTSQSFTDLIREIAVSKTISTRTVVEAK